MTFIDLIELDQGVDPTNTLMILSCVYHNNSEIASQLVAQGESMCLRVAYLTFTKRILEELVVNTDHTGFYLMTTRSERTYATRGSRDVVTGVDSSTMLMDYPIRKLRLYAFENLQVAFR
ncbi:hypothetical protein R1sor_005570 [Riccia sorocarpa]|uniref:Uncharacterized protein n=1 Tax=Riccia sorocarpa TaxID=122646 RepID=A0ABD3HNN3_9MARC